MVTPNTDDNAAELVAALTQAREIEASATQRFEQAEFRSQLAYDYFAQALERQDDLAHLHRLLGEHIAEELNKIAAVHAMWTARFAHVQAQALAALGGGA